jgi:antibiotic biosynthesis monooxygenase (ABM) superfamily enzyme
VSEPVTVVVTRRVRLGREIEYEAWLDGLIEQVSSTLPGYLGAEIHRPASGSREYTSVFRFDSLEDLRRFETSDLRAKALAEVAPLVDADAIWKRRTGLEVWFEPPPGSLVPQPSRPRMVVVITVVVYLLVVVIGTLAARLAGDVVPAPIRLLGVIAVEVTLMTYLIMPVLTRRLARWIYPSAEAV